MSTVKTSVRPLFVKDSDMIALGLQSVTPYEMCTAAIRASSPSSLEGVQKINDLWRLYMKDHTSRLELCLRQNIMMHGKKVALYDNNPYTSHQPSPDQLNGAPQQQNDKLTIKNLPLAVSNDEIKNTVLCIFQYQFLSQCEITVPCKIIILSHIITFI